MGTRNIKLCLFKKNCSWIKRFNSQYLYILICESCKGHSKIVVEKRSDLDVHICGESISKGLHSGVLFQSSTLLLLLSLGVSLTLIQYPQFLSRFASDIQFWLKCQHNILLLPWWFPTTKLLSWYMEAFSVQSTMLLLPPYDAMTMKTCKRDSLRVHVRIVSSWFSF